MDLEGLNSHSQSWRFQEPERQKLWALTQDFFQQFLEKAPGQNWEK